MAVTREYKCKKCSFSFQERVPINEKIKTKCPSCNGGIYQIYGDQSVLWFNMAGTGAISNRFETKGYGGKRPWDRGRTNRTQNKKR